MFKIKYCLGIGLLLLGMDIWAHMTIAGFERTLNVYQRRHLGLFIQNAKRELYTKCHYSPVYKTVICQSQAGERRLFKFK